MCFSVYWRLWRVGSVRWRCWEVPEGMRCVLLCMLEAGLCLLGVLDVMRCVLRAMEAGLCLLEVLDVLDVM